MNQELQIHGKLNGKVAVITVDLRHGAGNRPSGLLKRPAYVFNHGPEAGGADEAVRLIGRNVNGVRGDAGQPMNLDRLFGTPVQEGKGQDRCPVREERPQAWAKRPPWRARVRAGISIAAST